MNRFEIKDNQEHKRKNKEHHSKITWFGTKVPISMAEWA